MFPLFYLVGVFLFIFPTVRLPGIGISPSDFFLFGGAGWFLFEIFLLQRHPRRVLPLHSLWIPALLILFGGMVSSIRAVSQLGSLWVGIKIWFVLSLWISMTIVMVQRGYLYTILAVFVFSGIVTSIVAVVDQIVPENLYSYFVANDITFWNRASGTFGHPNSLGFLLAVALPLAVALLLQEWQTRKRVLVCVALVASSVLMAYVLFSSGSVSSWVGTLVAVGILVVFYLWRANFKTRLAVALSIIAICLGGFAILTQDLVRDQVVLLLQFNLGRATSVTGPGRFYLLEEALTVLDANPFIGAGLDQTGTGGLANDQLVTDDVIHNTLISSWLNGGLFAFLGLLLAYAIVLITALRAFKYGIIHKNWAVLGLSAVTFGWVLIDQTQPQLTFRFTWMIVGLLFGLGFGVQWTRAPSRAVGQKAIAPPVSARALSEAKQ